MALVTHQNLSLKDAARELQLRVQGAVILPGDAEYDAARIDWNLSFEHRPAVIVVAAVARDAAEAVKFAREQGLTVAPRGTGHGGVRPADDALLLVTRKLTDIRIDVEAQTAWVGAGLKWGEVLEQATAVGLAPLLGSSPDVGVVGYTLGGGMGWLGRKYGLSADSVNYFELVTPDGKLTRASKNENSDLFWALRGGGGNFGVVTGMEIRLYPVETVYAGNLFYPVEMAREVFLRYREWVKDAPDELTSSISIMNFPPFPQMPDWMRGQTLVIVRGMYSGALEDGEKLLKFWREWQAPIVDGWGVLPFAMAGKVSDEPLDPTPSYSTGAWLREISDEVIDTLISKIPHSPLVFAEIRHAGGAISRVSREESAYGNRDAQHILHMLGVTPNADAYAAAKAHAEQVKRALAPAMTGGVYINFLEGAEARRRTRDAYEEQTFARLQAVKAKYDPDNYFDHSFKLGK